jgi:hypothetical protein
MITYFFCFPANFARLYHQLRCDARDLIIIIILNNYWFRVRDARDLKTTMLAKYTIALILSSISQVASVYVWRRRIWPRLSSLTAY